MNLQDQQYGFRAQIMTAMREFCLRAMRVGVAKNVRVREMKKNRSIVTLILINQMSFWIIGTSPI